MVWRDLERCLVLCFIQLLGHLMRKTHAESARSARWSHALCCIWTYFSGLRSPYPTPRNPRHGPHPPRITRRQLMPVEGASARGRGEGGEGNAEHWWWLVTGDGRRGLYSGMYSVAAAWVCIRASVACINSQTTTNHERIEFCRCRLP